MTGIKIDKRIFIQITIFDPLCYIMSSAERGLTAQFQNNENFHGICLQVIWEPFICFFFWLVTKQGKSILKGFWYFRVCISFTPIYSIIMIYKHVIESDQIKQCTVCEKSACKWTGCDGVYLVCMASGWCCLYWDGVFSFTKLCTILWISFKLAE